MEQTRQAAGEKAVLAGLDAACFTREETASETSLEELQALLETAGGECVGTVLQSRPTPDPHSFVGQGKAEEIRDLVKETGAKLVIFDNDLTPSQIKALESITGASVLDRSALILDIFAQRAKTREGKLQVELAQYQYYLPRLTVWNETMGRLGGGIGTRGPGETQLETDKRHIRSRVAKLRQELLEVRQGRGVQRRQRMKNNVPVVALVGYTNVGKSSLLNALCGEQIFEADMLFATLDPTARKLVLPSGLQIILVDTVGFVSRLPHHLVEAFKSTLEEAAFADVIVKVADAGDAQAADQLAVTDEVLGSLDCEGIPQLVVYNKCDTANTVAFDPDILLTSAKTGYGLPALLAKLDEVLNHRVRTIEIVLPYDKLALADILRSRGSVAAEEYREDGVYYRGTVKIDDLHRFEEFLV